MYLSYLFTCLFTYLFFYLFYNTIIRLFIINLNREKEISEFTRIQELKVINRDFNITIHDFNITIARLRALRDLYRINSKDLVIKNKDLKK